METSETGTLLKAGLRPPWMLAPFDCDIQSGGSNHFKVESMRDFSVLCVCVCVCVRSEEGGELNCSFSFVFVMLRGEKREKKET